MTAMITVDPRLALNEAQLKRSVKRLKQAWATPLKLTQAADTLAQVLGFEGAHHLQRSVMASAPKPPLTILAEALAPWLHGGPVRLEVTPEAAYMLVPEGRTVTRRTVDLGMSPSSVWALADQDAPWDRQTALTLASVSPAVSFTLTPRPIGATRVALDVLVQPSTRAVTAPLDGIGVALRSLIQAQTTGTVLHFSQENGTAAPFVAQISRYRMSQGAEVTLWDPQGSEVSSVYPAPFRHVGPAPVPEGIVSALGPIHLVLGQPTMAFHQRALVDGLRQRRPHLETIQASGVAEDLFQGLWAWVRHHRQDEDPSAQARIQALSGLYAVIFHQPTPTGILRTFLGPQALRELQHTPNAKWPERLATLTQTDTVEPAR